MQDDRPLPLVLIDADRRRLVRAATRLLGPATPKTPCRTPTSVRWRPKPSELNAAQAWLLTVVRNLAIDRLRRRQWMQQWLEGMAASDTATAAPSAESDAALDARSHRAPCACLRPAWRPQTGPLCCCTRCSRPAMPRSPRPAAGQKRRVASSCAGRCCGCGKRGMGLPAPTAVAEHEQSAETVLRALPAVAAAARPASAVGHAAPAADPRAPGVCAAAPKPHQRNVGPRKLRSRTPQPTAALCRWAGSWAWC